MSEQLEKKTLVCGVCGTAEEAGKKFCVNCGTPFPEDAPVPAPAAPAPPPPAAPPQQSAPAPAPAELPPPPKGTRYAVLGMWGYIWSMIVLSIPLLGLILSVLWVGGKAKNQNRRNLAKATLFFYIVSILAGAAGLIFCMPQIREIWAIVAGA